MLSIFLLLLSQSLPFPGPGNTHSAASMCCSIVQTGGNFGTAGTSTVVFGSAPGTGNLLVCGYTDLVGAQTPPAGWAQKNLVTAGGNTQQGIYTHTVGASEPNSYTFSTNASDGHNSIGCYEILGSSGINGTPQSDPQGSTTMVTPTQTPSVIPTLALTFASGLFANALISVSAGWTSDIFENNVFGPIWTAHRNMLTSDTTTAISNTFTFTSTTTYVGTIVLMQ